MTTTQENNIEKIGNTLASSDRIKRSIYDVYLDDDVVVNILDIQGNLESLLDLEILLLEQISQIKSQVTLAKTKAATEGIYSDPHWFRKAVVCEKAKSRQLLIIQSKIREARRVEQENSVGKKLLFYRTFHKECVKYLRPETVATITHQTNVLLKLESGDGYLE